MAVTSHQENAVVCQCGLVELRVDGPPIAHAACYCRSCQEAGRLVEELPNASPVLGSDKGTDYVLYRKDRVQCVRGAEHLREFRLKPTSPTRRVVACCCNSAMVLDFTKGHWLTIYRGCITGPIPSLQMRMMTVEKPEGVTLPGDVPQYRTHAGKLMWKLLRARLAMGLGAPAAKGIPTAAPELKASSI